ncbi:hypothetical protein BH18ACT6_BH18ACT6_15390 [soil metagenome]
MDGIHIPAETAEAAQVPADLDSASVGPYRFPSPLRRRTAAFIYLGLAVALAVALRDWRWSLVAVLGLWHLRAVWPLNLGADEALAAAAGAAPFPIGQASAAIIFSGWRSRPLWHVVLYDAAEPPAARALVVIDGVDGNQIGSVYTEQLPLD